MKISNFATNILIITILVFGLLTPSFQARASVVNPDEPCNSSTSPTNQPCTLAYNTSSPSGLGAVILKLQYLLNLVIPTLIALGVVYFIWGVVQYVIGDSEEAKKKGRDHMIFGIIGLAVIIGLWGLVYLVADVFDVGQSFNAPTNDIHSLLPQ